MMLERTLCGLELTRDTRKSAKTPYRHGCSCSRYYSSAQVCHRCSCVACTAERAKWNRYIARGGVLGEVRRERASAARRKHAKRA